MTWALLQKLEHPRCTCICLFSCTHNARMIFNLKWIYFKNKYVEAQLNGTPNHSNMINTWWFTEQRISLKNIQKILKYVSKVYALHIRLPHGNLLFHTSLLSVFCLIFFRMSATVGSTMPTSLGLKGLFDCKDEIWLKK